MKATILNSPRIYPPFKLQEPPSLNFAGTTMSSKNARWSLGVCISSATRAVLLGEAILETRELPADTKAIGCASDDGKREGRSGLGWWVAAGTLVDSGCTALKL